MTVNEKYPVLIGYTDDGERSELHSIKEVAEYICEKGLYSDLNIITEDGMPFLNTFGIYIDRIADMEYREELLKTLIPMQTNIDGCECCEESTEEGIIGETADMQMT